ncbi:hypothetical protein [Lactobacillus johnsonii]|jgi:hypothetical protein|nr:hypothetical protein [Lactobacillus johnsonii]AYN49728.1 hypothetical protein LJ1_01192 [Lactobacillus johnsonii]WNW28493.1 hypothetical protein RP299_08015 [Lactobacillus johnsonii]
MDEVEDKRARFDYANLAFFMCVGHDITSSPLKYGSRVFVAKCSEPQAGNGDVMSEGSG